MTWASSRPSAFLSLGDVLLDGPRGLPWTHRLSALNPLLQPTFRSRAPVAKTRSPETSCRAPWENPAVVLLRDPLGRGVAAVVPEDAGPPCGHPASSGSVLDGTWPASGRGSLSRRALARGVHARQLCRLRVASLLEPSDALSATGGEARERSASCRRSCFPGPIVKPARFREIRAPSTVTVRSSTLAGLARRLTSAGRRALWLHVLIKVR
jgi:hypothetical protein